MVGTLLCDPIIGHHLGTGTCLGSPFHELPNGTVEQGRRAQGKNVPVVAVPARKISAPRRARLGIRQALDGRIAQEPPAFLIRRSAQTEHVKLLPPAATGVPILTLWSPRRRVG